MTVTALDIFDLKSNMDRFIGYNVVTEPQVGEI